MTITLCDAKTIIRQDIRMTLKTAKALRKARGKNAAVHPGNYLEHHLALSLAQRRTEAEEATNCYERLVLRI